jgi:hypothetical protein
LPSGWTLEGFEMSKSFLFAAAAFAFWATVVRANAAA